RHASPYRRGRARCYRFDLLVPRAGALTSYEGAQKSPAAGYRGVAHHRESPNDGTAVLYTHPRMRINCSTGEKTGNPVIFNLSLRIGTTHKIMSRPLACGCTIPAELRSAWLRSSPVVTPWAAPRGLFCPDLS